VAEAETEMRFDELPEIPEGSTLAAEWWLAWGHLKSKKSEAFLSVITLLSVVGVLAGVAMLNWVMAVMTGFEIDMRDKILGANAHVILSRYGGNIVDIDEALEGVEAVDGVLAASPFLLTEMMLRSPWGSTGVIIKGVDPVRTADVTHLLEDLTEGYDGPHQLLSVYDDGDLDIRRQVISSLVLPFPPMGLDRQAMEVTSEQPELPGIVIGSELQTALQVQPGDRVQLINPLGSGAGPMGMPTPSVRSMRVAAVFDSGMYEYDTKWTYAANTVLQDFLKVGNSASAVEIKVHDIEDAGRVGDEIEEQLGYPYYTRNWMTLNAKLFAALSLEKWVMGLLLNMIVVNAGLLIITTLIMVVVTKGREIAILKAMGATRGTIMRVFLMEGVAIGTIGTVLGTIAGLAGCWFLDRLEYPLETDVYELDTLPVVIDPTTVATIAFGAFVICLLCTIYPALRASSLDPVEALSYE